MSEYMPKISFARLLRRNQTAAEKKLWNKIRARRFCNLKFKRQVPIGKYIADFVCYRYKLVIEVDGWIHLYRKEYDRRRDDYLRSRGYTVLRLANHEVLHNIPEALQKIKYAIHSNTKAPLSSEEERGRR